VGSGIATVVVSFDVLAPVEYKGGFMKSSPGPASRDGQSAARRLSRRQGSSSAVATGHGALPWSLDWCPWLRRLESPAGGIESPYIVAPALDQLGVLGSSCATGASNWLEKQHRQ
jgi:hypothetical protein